MHIPHFSTTRVFVQTINAIKSNSSKLSNNIHQFVRNLTSAYNSKENINSSKAWKKEEFPSGAQKLVLKHPYEYQNIHPIQSNDIVISTRNNTMVVNKSTTTDNIPIKHMIKPIPRADLAEAIRQNKGLISKPITLENTPAIFKNFYNIDAF